MGRHKKPGTRITIRLRDWTLGKLDAAVAKGHWGPDRSALAERALDVFFERSIANSSAERRIFRELLKDALAEETTVDGQRALLRLKERLKETPFIPF